MRLVPLTLACALLALTQGCAASGYYDAAVKLQTVNPHAAIEYVSLCLSENPDHEKAIDLISELGSRMRDDHKERIKTLEANQAWEDAVSQCDRMTASCETVAKMPHGIQIYHDTEERTRFAKLAAKKFYEAGLKLEAENHAKEASIAFRRALGFQSDFKDARMRYEKAVKGAMVKVAVVGFDSLVPSASGYTQTLGRGTLSSCVAKNPELLTLVPADKLDDTCQGKLNGSITSASFQDSGWVVKPGHKNSTVREKGSDGEYHDRKIECHWKLFERQTHFAIKASYKVENCKTGAAMAAGEASAEASDLKKYIEAGGDEDLLPSELKDLPRSPSEPRGEPALAQECADRVAEALGLELFKNFK